MLFKYEANPTFNKVARMMDWALAWAMIPLTVFLFWRSWPNPDFLAWSSLAMIGPGFLLAKYDWKGGVERTVQGLLARWLAKA